MQYGLRALWYLTFLVAGCSNSASVEEGTSALVVEVETDAAIRDASGEDAFLEVDSSHTPQQAQRVSLRSGELPAEGLPPQIASFDRIQPLLSRGESLALVRVEAMDHRMVTREIDGVSYHSYQGSAQLRVLRTVKGGQLPEEISINFPMVQYSVELVEGQTYLLPLSLSEHQSYRVPMRHSDPSSQNLLVRNNRLEALNLSVDQAAERMGRAR